MMFRELYEKLTAMYLKSYIENEDAMVKSLCESAVPLQILNSVYKQFVIELVFQEIEVLPKQKKEQLFKRYKDVNIPVPVENIPKVCAAIYTLEFLSKNV